MTLTPRQKRTITRGDAKWGVALQLFRKGIVEKPTKDDEFLHPESKARMAALRLTKNGEKVLRMIEDPTVDHL